MNYVTIVLVLTQGEQEVAVRLFDVGCKLKWQWQ